MITIFHKSNATETIVQEVAIPDDVPENAWLDLIINGNSEVNIFDVEFILEVFENDKWVTRDRTFIGRDIDNPEATFPGMTVQLYDIAGKNLRATLICGQSLLSVNATLLWQ